MLKKVIVFAQLIILTLSSNAQSVTENKKAKYGFSFGVNRSSLAFEKTPRSREEKEIGLRLGILAEYSICSQFYFTPRVELSVYKNSLIYSVENSFPQEYEYMPIGLEGKLNFIYKFREEEKLMPYLLGGASYIHSVERELENFEFPNKSTITVDIGVGLERKFAYFTFSPEFRYSHGLTDINEDPAVKEKILLHNFSVVLIFKG